MLIVIIACYNNIVKAVLVKFRYSEKATKIWPIFHLEFDATISNAKKRAEERPIFCGLLRISEL